MKLLLLVSAVLVAGATSNAQMPPPHTRSHILHDGESRYVYDTQTGQYMNLVCNAYDPMPVPPPQPIPVPQPRTKVCELRFNPVGDSCSKFRVYVDGAQGSDCMSTLQQAIVVVNSMRSAGLCHTRRAESQCDLRFNPVGDSCSKYRIYIAGKQSSDCMADLTQAELVVREFRQANLCN